MIPTDLSPLENHLWQSSLCAVGVWLLTLLLRKNRAAVRYWLWLAASVKFLFPFSLLVSIGGHLGWRSAPVITQPHLSLVSEMSRPFRISPEVLTLAVATRAPSELPMILLGVWLCGFTLGVIFWLRSVRQVRAVGRTAAPLPLNLPIPVRSSAARVEPGVFGIFRPVLILPAGITERLTPAQLEAVLAHELCHVRRKDNLTATIHMVVEVIFWFHPLVWWIRIQLVAERERACDEEVVRAAGDPQVYAEAILNVCKFYLQSPLACVSGVSGANLRKRIAEIMAGGSVHNLSWGKKILLAAVAIGAAAAPIAIGILHMPTARAQSVAAESEFEVASIRPTDPAFSGRRIDLAPDHSILTMRGMTLKGLVQLAYNPGFGLLHPSLVTGGPKWSDHNRYDISAKPPGQRIPSQEERKQMLKALLVERFKLTFHRASRQITVFALVVGKNGPHMKKGKPDPSGDPVVLKGLTLTGRNASMDQLAAVLQPMIPLVDPEHADFPVLDRTGLTGRFDFDLAWSLEQAQADGRTGTSPNSNLPDLLTAIQDQLGLKLKLMKTPVDVLVIDHAETPSEN